MNWVTLDRDHHPFRYPQAIECPTCGALCATEGAAKKHEAWHVATDLIADKAKFYQDQLAKAVGALQEKENDLAEDFCFKPRNVSEDYPPYDPYAKSPILKPAAD